MPLSDTAYRKLKSRERMPLLLDAKARRDDVEVKRLIDTLPRVELTNAPPLRHTAMEDAIGATANRVGLELCWRLGEVQQATAIQGRLAEREYGAMSDDQREQLERFVSNPFDEPPGHSAAALTQITTRAEPDMSDEIDWMIDRSSAVAAGLVSGYDRLLTERVSTTARTVFRAFFPSLDHHLEAFQIYATPGDPEAAEVIHRDLVKIWDAMMGRFA